MTKSKRDSNTSVKEEIVYFFSMGIVRLFVVSFMALIVVCLVTFYKMSSASFNNHTYVHESATQQLPDPLSMEIDQ